MNDSHLMELCGFHLNLYHKNLLRMKMYGEGKESNFREVDNTQNNKRAYMEVIETALSQLSKDEYTILCALYFENKGPKDMIGLYARSTFHRIKPRAIRRFIHCLHC
jgi:hypothetical protein